MMNLSPTFGHSWNPSTMHGTLANHMEDDLGPLPTRRMVIEGMGRGAETKTYEHHHHENP